MSENNICVICGGYIGNAILAQTLTSGSASIAPIKFCLGHSMTDAELYRPFTVGHFPIMCTGVGSELVTLPTGSSVYPNNYLQQQETLWQIAQEVAERDLTYGTDVDLDDKPRVYLCPVCDGELSALDHSRDIVFQHNVGCIVTKARELMEWRKAQPRVDVKINYQPGLSRLVDEARRQIERSETEDGGFDGEVPRD